MTRTWQRLLAFVPTRRAALALFAIAFLVYWVESIGWPMAKGRDTWDYLLYYLQLFDTDPPISELQLFRTPLTPIVVGLPLDIGGIWLLEIVFALLYASTILGWSAAALTFGRIPALFTAVLLVVYPAFATLYHQASSDAVFATGFALWAWLLARAMQTPTGWRFAAVGAGIAMLVLIRPANQILLPLALAPLVAYAAWRRRLVLTGVCVVAALAPLAAWALHNGIRYDEPTVARGGRAWVPFLQVFTGDRTISPENGIASRRLAELIQREVLSRDPHARIGVTLDTYLQNGSNYETVRLIALSDRVFGEDANYDVLFDSALEAIREHPGTYGRGVANTLWDFLVQKPLREDVAPREQTAPKAPSPTFDVDGVMLPNPQATVLLVGVPYGFVWCASDYIDSCTVENPSEVWSDPDLQERYRELVAQVRAWDAELPSRAGSERCSGDPQPDHAALPHASAVASGRVRRPRNPSTARLADDPAPLGSCLPGPLDPRRVARGRTRVRAACLPGVHRRRARGACW